MTGSRVPGSGSGSHRSSQSRLRVRISRHASWSRTSSGRSITRGPDQGRLATSSHRAKVIHYPDPMPTNGDKGRERLVWLDLEMTGLDVEPPRHRRDRRARHRRRPRTARRRHRPHRPPAAERARRDGRLRAAMHTKSGLLAGDRGVDALARRRRRAGARLRARRTSARAAHRCAATRSASTGGSSTASSPSSTSSCTTAASTCRASRSCAGAGTRPSTRVGPGKSETHRALADVLESIAELQYYREHMLRAPVGRRRANPRSSRRAPSSVVTERSRAEWPMRPMRHALPANCPSPPPTSMP